MLKHGAAAHLTSRYIFLRREYIALAGVLLTA
jgi:hypothetical protein